jgi:hypothetical protein
MRAYIEPWAPSPTMPSLTCLTIVCVSFDLHPSGLGAATNGNT